MIRVAAPERRAWRIELHLHETGAWVPADVVRVSHAAAVEDVRVAVRRTCDVRQRHTVYRGAAGVGR